MSVNNNQGNVAYGLNQALNDIPQAPIISKRAPTSKDFAPIGATWIDKTINAVYTLTSIVSNSATWVLSGSSAPIAAVVSPTTTVTINARAGNAAFAGFTTAAFVPGDAPTIQVFNINNSFVTTLSAVLVTVFDYGSNASNMTLVGVKPANGSLAVSVANFGVAALNGEIDIAFVILQ